MGVRGSTKFVTSALRWAENHSSTAEAPSQRRNVRGLETERSAASPTIATRVQTDIRLSWKCWENAKNATTTASAATEVFKKPKYRYDKYPRKTAIPLQLPLRTHIEKSAAISAYLGTPFRKRENASGRLSTAKNDSELGFQKVPYALPSCQGRMNVSARGSNPRRWITA